MRISVLRLGHRKKRDERLTTHVGLVARAFGADGIIISGERDPGVLQSVKDVARRWGGPLSVKFEEDWKKVIRAEKAKGGRGASIVHLTMYGEPLQKKIAAIRKIAKRKRLMVLVGSEKVPGQIYLISDFNIAVTSQPHSEAAALAVFLHELFKGREKKFKGGRLKILPHPRGKRVVEKRY